MRDRGNAGGGVGGDGVVGGHVPEEGGVEATGAGHELADDNELAGVVGAVDHQRLQRLHAVETGDLRSGAIEVLAHADAGVEPHVAVQQVVAAAALDDVAAVAAEDDVAAVELIVGRAQNAVGTSEGGAQERAQAIDDVGIGERAALDARQSKVDRGVIVAAQEVVVGRSRQALGKLEAGEDLLLWRRLHVQLAYAAHIDGDAIVGIDAGAGVRDPIVAGPAFEPFLGGTGGHEDVVAALADHDDVTEAAGDEDVVAVAQVLAQRVGGVAEHFPGATLDPVTAVAGQDLVVFRILQDEVVAVAGEGLRSVSAGDDEVLARAADNDVVAGRADEDVVAFLAVQRVVAATTDENIVAGTAEQHVVAGTAVQPVLATVAVKRVTGVAADQDVVAAGVEGVARIGATKDGAPNQVTVVSEIVGVGAHRVGVVAHDQRNEGVGADGVGMAVGAQAGVELLRLVELEEKVRRLEDLARQMRRIGVRHDQVGERVVLELGQEVHSGGAVQVVEPVVVLQGLELVLEDVVEGRASISPKGAL